MILLRYCFVLSLFLMSSSVWAYPTRSILNSGFECGGGWNLNLLFYSSPTVAQFNVGFARGYSTLAKSDQKLKKQLKGYKVQLKRASASNRKKLNKLVKAANTLLAYNAQVRAGIAACQAGTLVPPSPFATSGSTGVLRSTNYSLVAGGALFAYDGQFLGIVSSNKFDLDSIANNFGSFGSKFSPTSIFNNFGTYGSRYAQASCFNDYTALPPVIFMGAIPVAYLTTNNYLPGPRVDPYELASVIGRYEDTP